MRATYAPEQYNSRSFLIDMSPEDIGLAQPTSEEQFKAVLGELMFRAKQAIEIFYVKEGHHNTQQAIETLKVYKP